MVRDKVLNIAYRRWNSWAQVRQFVEKEVRPHIEEWEEMQDYPRELHEKAYAAGVYGYWLISFFYLSLLFTS